MVTCVFLYLYTVTVHCTLLFTSPDYTFQLATTKKLLDELHTTITHTNESVHPSLKHVNALLYNAVLACRAAMSKSTETRNPAGAFKTKAEYVAPGQNSEHQWRFHPTTKAAGRKRKGMVLRLGMHCVCIAHMYTFTTCVGMQVQGRSCH